MGRGEEKVFPEDCTTKSHLFHGFSQVLLQHAPFRRAEFLLSGKTCRKGWLCIASGKKNRGSPPYIGKMKSVSSAQNVCNRLHRNHVPAGGKPATGPQRGAGARLLDMPVRGRAAAEKPSASPAWRTRHAPAELLRFAWSRTAFSDYSMARRKRMTAARARKASTMRWKSF